MLRSVRRSNGRSQRWLADATGASLRTIERLEAGERRPSPSLLRSIAGALGPDDPKPLAARLIEAAGSSLAEDTPGKRRHWHRLACAAYLAGRRPWPSKIAREIALHTAASSARQEALSLLDRPGALDDAAILDEANRLMAMAEQLSREAGPPFVLRVGGHEFRYGFGL